LLAIPGGHSVFNDIYFLGAASAMVYEGEIYFAKWVWSGPQSDISVSANGILMFKDFQIESVTSTPVSTLTTTSLAWI